MFIIFRINSTIIYNNNENKINRSLIDENLFNKLLEFTENNNIISSVLYYKDGYENILKKSNGETISLQLYKKNYKIYCYKVDFNLDNIIPIDIFKNVYTKFFGNTNYTLFIKNIELSLIKNIEYSDDMLDKNLFSIKFNNSTIVIFYNNIILIEINKQINSVYMYYNKFLELFYDFEF
jgi:hydroxymethylpyrimidine pyrophosphatase-like HAD family hydrolase